MRVDGVASRGGHHGRPLYLESPVHFRVVEVAQDHFEARIVQAQCIAHVRNQQEIRIVVLVQFIDQGAGDRIMMSQQDVAAGSCGHLARRPCFRPRFHPRRVEEPDKRERQQDQHVHRAGTQYPHGEEAAQIRTKGDIPEPERRNHRQGPVDPGEPGELAPFPQHEQVEDHTVDGDDDDQHRQQAGQRPEVFSVGVLPQEMGELCGKRLHGVGSRF